MTRCSREAVTQALFSSLGCQSFISRTTCSFNAETEAMKRPPVLVASHYLPGREGEDVSTSGGAGVIPGAPKELMTLSSTLGKFLNSCTMTT